MGTPVEVPQPKRRIFNPMLPIIEGHEMDKNVSGLPLHSPELYQLIYPLTIIFHWISPSICYIIYQIHENTPLFPIDV